jgi:hypothetical protein
MRLTMVDEATLRISASWQRVKATWFASQAFQWNLGLAHLNIQVMKENTGLVMTDWQIVAVRQMFLYKKEQAVSWAHPQAPGVTVRWAHPQAPGVTVRWAHPQTPGVTVRWAHPQAPGVTLRWAQPQAPGVTVRWADPQAQGVTVKISLVAIIFRKILELVVEWLGRLAPDQRIPGWTRPLYLHKFTSAARLVSKAEWCVDYLHVFTSAARLMKGWVVFGLSVIQIT